MRRHLSFANVAATLALVLAMSGGAYAAKHYLITSTKQIKPSVLAAAARQARGRGARPGAAGTAGRQGRPRARRVLRASTRRCCPPARRRPASGAAATRRRGRTSRIERARRSRSSSPRRSRSGTRSTSPAPRRPHCPGRGQAEQRLPRASTRASPKTPKRRTTKTSSTPKRPAGTDEAAGRPRLRDLPGVEERRPDDDHRQLRGDGAMRLRRAHSPHAARAGGRRLSYAHVAAALALFFSLSSGALAARHFLLTSTKQIKPSVLSARARAGRRGAPVAPGAPGAAGPEGRARQRRVRRDLSSALPDRARAGPDRERRVGRRATKSRKDGTAIASPRRSRLRSRVLAPRLGRLRPQGLAADGRAAPAPASAAPGFLCLYEASSENLRDALAGGACSTLKSSTEPSQAAGRSGFAIELTARARRPVRPSAGTFAVTAPRGVEGREPAARSANGAGGEARNEAPLLRERRRDAGARASR